MRGEIKEGLVAILWENDRPGRVKLKTTFWLALVIVGMGTSGSLGASFSTCEAIPQALVSASKPNSAVRSTLPCRKLRGTECQT